MCKIPPSKASPIALATLGAQVAVAAMVVLASIRASQAAERCEPAVARIVSIQGLVEVQPAGAADWVLAALDDQLCFGDTIRVGDLARAAIALANDSVLRFDQRTTLRLAGEVETGRSLLDLLFGDVHFFSHRPRALEVDTPIANAAAEGTEFLIRARPERTEVVMLDGRVRLTTAEGEVLLASGDAGGAVAGAAPRREIVARPRDAVAWALYYPPVLAPLAAGEAAPALPPGLQRAVERVAANDYAGALAALDAVPEAARDARYHAYRAGVLLNVGRVEEAAAAIERVLALDPETAEALAQRAIIGVVQNRREEALADAQRAVELAPDSAPARIALSYALQAAFQLDEARAVLREAAERIPDDPLVFARLAEIELSFGELDAAQEAAERAVALAPALARTQMVLGFAALTRIAIDDAKAAFGRAIELDSAEPLARLGLGLATIRQGDLEEGRRELEIAAALDRNNSLLRSYLGKAYFEERRGPLDAEQFRIAKELDPNDPTPWFYDAIRLQTENRPVEALRDLQTSIRLNDNRAVYRSRLLLDDDLAARGARLGRIYNDLGFEQLGLVEGWRSVAQAPDNFSAHRLLADTYAILPRHDIAQDSELLQAQMLQPINIDPVQPRLADNGLSFLRDTGPSGAGFNEFTRLFTRNEPVRIQADGIAGTQDTKAAELILSGLADNVSYSLGQFHTTTDGFRDNHDLRQTLTNIFGQVSVDPRLSIQVEVRALDEEFGDRNFLFDSSNFRRRDRTDRNIQSVRFGTRHNLSQNSTLLTSLFYSDFDVTLDVPDFGLQGDLEDELYSLEIRNIYRHRLSDLDAGLLATDGDQSTQFVSPGVMIEDHTDLTLFNIYVYNHWKITPDARLTVGSSLETFEDFISDKTQINPKFGGMWDITDATTIRAAAFRTMKRPFISNQTLEPTHVAGFNQFFDDINGTQSWRFGFGVDHSINERTFIGSEVSYRELDVPRLTLGGGNRDNDASESFGRVYAYWAPWKFLALSAEYQFESFDENVDTSIVALDKVRTHRMPLEARFFHRDGWFARVRGTLADQDGRFVDTSGNVKSEKDRFFVVDAAVGLRIPQRYGLATLEIRNVFDQNFNFQESEPSDLEISPERVILGRLTLTF